MNLYAVHVGIEETRTFVSRRWPGRVVLQTMAP